MTRWSSGVRVYATSWGSIELGMRPQTPRRGFGGWNDGLIGEWHKGCVFAESARELEYLHVGHPDVFHMQSDRKRRASIRSAATGVALEIAALRPTPLASTPQDRSSTPNVSGFRRLLARDVEQS